MREGFTFGIDGGATRSRLAVQDTDGNRVRSVTGGPTNLYTGKPEEAALHLRELFDQVKEFGPFKAGCIGSAGLGREQERNTFSSILETLLPSVPVKLCSDGEILLTGGLGGPEGYALISGTGSIAMSRTKKGKTIRSGGYGYLLGDEGSAYWIAHQALMRSLRSLDGRDLPTAMLERLLEACALQKSEELVSYVHHKASKADIASLAPIVTTFAIQEDPLALAILEQAARELVALVKAVQNPEIQNNELVVAGGVLEHDPVVRPLFEHFLSERLEHLVLIESRGTALDGACLLARDLERKEK